MPRRMRTLTPSSAVPTAVGATRTPGGRLEML
jgi:hypothetical protein